MYVFSWIPQFDLFPLQDILYLHNSLEEVNSALVGYQRQNDLKLEGMNETVSNLTQRVNLIETDLVAVSKVEKQANLSLSMVSLFGSFVVCSVLQCVLSTWMTLHRFFRSSPLAYLKGYAFIPCFTLAL